MYLPNQVIYDLTQRKAVTLGSDVWDLESYPDNPTRHFVIHTGQWSRDGDVVKLFVPRSVAQAESLLACGLIAPAPFDGSTHCWRCGNWHNNCRQFGCRAQKGLE
jgi:hypothetical protein